MKYNITPMNTNITPMNIPLFKPPEGLAWASNTKKVQDSNLGFLIAPHYDTFGRTRGAFWVGVGGDV